MRRRSIAALIALAVLSSLVLSAGPADAHQRGGGGSAFPDNGWINPIEDGRYQRSDFGQCVDGRAHLGVDSKNYPARRSVRWGTGPL